MDLVVTDTDHVATQFEKLASGILRSLESFRGPVEPRDTLEADWSDATVEPHRQTLCTNRHQHNRILDAVNMIKTSHRLDERYISSSTTSLGVDTALAQRIHLEAINHRCIGRRSHHPQHRGFGVCRARRPRRSGTPCPLGRQQFRQQRLLLPARRPELRIHRPQQHCVSGAVQVAVLGVHRRAATSLHSGQSVIHDGKGDAIPRRQSSGFAVETLGSELCPPVGTDSCAPTSKCASPRPTSP